jgi:ubiquinone/menaquinone biosynthesis C-methylase UbiE
LAWTLDVYGDETAALAEIADFTDRRVLEIGAGDGRLTWLIGHDAASLLAIDPDEERIEQARADIPGELADRVTLSVMDAVELEVPRKRFDVALLSWSL